MSKKTCFRITALAGTVILVILLRIDFPRDLWTPSDAGEFLRAFLTAGMIACYTLAIQAGPVLWIKDWLDEDPDEDLSAISGNLSMMMALGFVSAVVLVIRYLYLIMR